LYLASIDIENWHGARLPLGPLLDSIADCTHWMLWHRQLHNERRYPLQSPSISPSFTSWRLSLAQ